MGLKLGSRMDWTLVLRMELTLVLRMDWRTDLYSGSLTEAMSRFLEQVQSTEFPKGPTPQYHKI